MIKKPSISELLKLLDKPALLNWANKQGLLGVDISKERKKWMSDGTSLHKQIELYHNNKTPFENPTHQKIYDNFISDKEVLNTEKDLECDYFTGRYDMRLKWNDKIYLIDFKRKQKYLYFENKLQLVAYSMCEECDSFAVIGIPDFNVLPFELIDRNPYIEIIKSLSNIYRYKKEIELNSNLTM